MDAGLVTDLLKQLGSFTADQQALQELQLPVGVDDEVKRLQHNLAVVQAMLSEVEERTLTDPAVKPWYDQLKDAYYMMDDLLDIWNTARIKSQIQKEEEVAEPADISTPAVRKTVCSFIPSPSCCFNLPMHHDVGGKIKTLNETLDMIINGMEKYGIDLNRQPEVVDRPITNFVGENEVFGLIDYKKVVLEMLLINSSEETNPLVISLVGGESDEICKMGELENLNHIQGSLRIQGLKNVVDLVESQLLVWTLQVSSIQKPSLIEIFSLFSLISCLSAQILATLSRHAYRWMTIKTMNSG
nr:putative disease resistance protein rga1 [Quercus suber]